PHAFVIDDKGIVRHEQKGVTNLAAAITKLKGAKAEAPAPAPAKAEAPAPQDAASVLKVNVTDAANRQPVAGAQLDASFIIDGKRQEGAARGDGDGSFQVPIPDPPPQNLRVEASGRGYAARAIQWPIVPNGAKLPKSYTFELERGQTISGVVHDEAGNAVANVLVRLIVPNSGAFGEPYDTWHEARTDASGRWTMTDAPPELRSPQIVLEHPRYSQTSVRDVPPAGKLLDGSAELVIENPLAVHGVGKDQDGKPLASAFVQVTNIGTISGSAVEPKVQSGADGTFSVARPPGDAVVVAWDDSHAPIERRIHLARGMQPVELTLPPGNHVAGRVVDKSGQPIAGAAVRLDRIGGLGGNLRVDWSATTD